MQAHRHICSVLVFSSFMAGILSAQTAGWKPLFDGKSLDNFTQRGGVAGLHH